MVYVESGSEEESGKQNEENDGSETESVERLLEKLESLGKLKQVFEKL